MNRAPLYWAAVGLAAVALGYSRKAEASTGNTATEAPADFSSLFGNIFVPEITIQGQSITANVLAQTAWGEARGQGAAGMQAVINVVMNRAAVSARTVLPDWWGETVSQICQKSLVANGVRYWQFDCWNPAGPNLAAMRAVTPDDPAYHTALTMALRALLGELPDITGGATHYYANYITAPAWVQGATKTAQYGRHLFFKDVA